MSVIVGIREFLNRFPSIGESHIDVDFTSKNPVAYGLASTGQEETSSFLDGSKVIQYSFTLSMRQYTNIDEQRIENANFMQNLADWIIRQDLEGNYPQLGKDKTVMSMKCSNPILLSKEEAVDMGTYQIQIKINYLQGV